MHFRHKARREFSVQTMIPKRTDVGNAVVGPRLPKQCRLPRDALECPTLKTALRFAGVSNPGMPDRSSQTFDFPCSGRQEQLRSRFHPIFATTFRKQDNAFFGACKMHFCRRRKIHTALKTNAFTWARKMHFATLPERMPCADNVSKSNRSCECGLWALVCL